jgi:hypothetical protein
VIECFHCHRSEIEKPVNKTCPCHEPVCLSCATECVRREDEYEEWEICHECGGEGVSGHDCGEDTCCCRNPVDNMACKTCNGEGGWTP